MAVDIPPTGTRVTVATTDGDFTGVVMERSALDDEDHVVLKLESGYNIGIEREKISSIKKHKKDEMPSEEKPAGKERPSANLPRVAVLATGGTIASRVDYVTGGVVSATSGAELVTAVPELADIAHLTATQVFNKFSENLAPPDWLALARAAHDVLKDENPEGVVVTHGTDTMGYSSAALSFMLQTPVPVVFTGAQRSSDRGSSDAALNLAAATRFAARADYAGTVVAMHASSSDDAVAVHPGTRVKKLHASRRDAFKTVGDSPVAQVNGEVMSFNKKDIPSRSSTKLTLNDALEENVVLVKYAPGLKPGIIDGLVKEGIRGIVIEGTGLGHVSDAFLPPIKEAIASGVTIVMTSQTVWGRVNMRVYATGRNLLEAGVIGGEDMLAETAYVKLMWALAQEKKPEKIRELMLTNLAGELTLRSIYEDEETG